MKRNDYISRYNKGNDSFKRTDPWRYEAWKDETTTSKVLTSIAFVACVVMASLVILFAESIDMWMK